MNNALAKFVTYAAMLVDGNLVTNLISIGGKSRKTGPDPPPPAIVGGLNTHDVFEGNFLRYHANTSLSHSVYLGDASMTRADAYFGDIPGFNQTLFDQVRLKILL